MARKTMQQTKATPTPSAYVIAQAQQDADATWMPQTLVWMPQGECFDSRCFGSEYREPVTPIVTMLPARYWVRAEAA